MALEPTKHVNGRMWPPGVSGNPNVRPVGSRTVFSQGFVKDLAEIWAERGRAAMEKTAIDQPGVFFATCARASMEAYPNLKPWKPGQSGTLDGRPVGSSLRLPRGSRVIWPRFGSRRARPQCSTRPRSSRRCSLRLARGYSQMTFGLRFEQ